MASNFYCSYKALCNNHMVYYNQGDRQVWNYIHNKPAGCKQAQNIVNNGARCFDRVYN